ncbi:hypothetical protein Scep_014110 [Stephania cephalantha]|uniref:Uncharacterized protein n=1 Tax=Stephania cephalantha TaxID=152367 RepID=A0AAP0J0N6_9MAGN
MTSSHSIRNEMCFIRGAVDIPHSRHFRYGDAASDDRVLGVARLCDPDLWHPHSVSLPSSKLQLINNNGGCSIGQASVLDFFRWLVDEVEFVFSVRSVDLAVSGNLGFVFDFVKFVVVAV